MTDEQQRRAAISAPAGNESAAAVWADQVREVYGHVRGPLWRALVAWSGSTDVADEAVAEGFAQLLRRGPDVRDPAAWVWRASFKLAAGDLKVRRDTMARRRGGGDGPGRGGAGLGRRAPYGHEHDRQHEATADLVGPVDRLPDDAIDLVRALAKLSDQQRRCIALVDIAGHTAPSAASVLGTTGATVRVQLMRARRHLRTMLADPDDPTRSGRDSTPSGRGSSPDLSAVSDRSTGSAPEAPR